MTAAPLERPPRHLHLPALLLSQYLYFLTRRPISKSNLSYLESQSIEWSGPLYRGAQLEGGQVRVFFAHTGGGLADRNGDALLGFTIAGADKNVVSADAVICGESVVVSSPSVPSPAWVRYAWASNPSAVDLKNGAGLPASPFRTDGPEPPMPDSKNGWQLR